MNSINDGEQHPLCLDKQTLYFFSSVPSGPCFLASNQQVLTGRTIAPTMVFHKLELTVSEGSSLYALLPLIVWGHIDPTTFKTSLVIGLISFTHLPIPCSANNTRGASGALC